MARHAEISEKAIIQAALELEAIGKRPNPGAIRAHLGYKGGLLRIKSIWEQYDVQRKDKLIPKQLTELTFDALPQEYAQNASSLIERISEALEQLTIEAYTSCQTIYEKRETAIEKSTKEKLLQFEEAEKDADKSIKNLESDVDELQTEINSLAAQNAKLLIENAELKGRLSVFTDGARETDK
jgi:chromosome segregation ATPase